MKALRLEEVVPLNAVNLHNTKHCHCKDAFLITTVHGTVKSRCDRQYSCLISQHVIVPTVRQHKAIKLCIQGQAPQANTASQIVRFRKQVQHIALLLGAYEMVAQMLVPQHQAKGCMLNQVPKDSKTVRILKQLYV